MKRRLCCSLVVVTKTRNHPKRPKTTHNHPQRSTTNPKRSTTTYNDRQRCTTTHKTCDLFAESQFFYYNRLKQVRLINQYLKSILLFVFNLRSPKLLHVFLSVTKRFALKRALECKFRLSLVKVSLWQDF